MNSVSVFLEKEIKGKPYHIFSLLSQTDNSSSFSPSLSHEEAIDSGGDNYPSLQTCFLCPNLRCRAERLEQQESSSDDCIAPLNTSPHFFNKETIDRQVMFKSAYEINCKHPVLPLFWCNNEKPNVIGSHLRCGACKMPETGSGYYLCETCKKVYHKECVEAPLSIKHPSFPSLFLQLCFCSSSGKSCIFCDFLLDEFAYYFPTYNVGIHVVCALKAIPIVIDHFKRHPHPLTFFPKQAFLACNICGMIKELIPTYVCVRCVFVVHQDCIYFPYVIRISRHHHRISFTYSLPSEKLSCGVCRQKVDNSCGAYSCNKCDGYFVHSRCALREDVWDGEELEGIPEEIEIVEDPFETIADGIILHFTHEHHLKLEICRDYDDDKYCQGCVLPIYEGNYYSCVDDQCDFILHETCANEPRKKRHPLHAHPLTLNVVTSAKNSGFFSCNACGRNSNGFEYKGFTTVDGIFHLTFSLDLRCASVSEPFKYEGHEHPLFLALSPDEEKGATCHICHYHNRLYRRKLNCIECDYIICFQCATLPYKAKYKHDKHFLTFRKELVAIDQSDWCEVCEKKIVNSKEGGYYACDEYCCTTLHVDCLLGKDPYIKHGQIISAFGRKFHILRNNTMSRPFCRTCEERCPHRVFFQLKHSTFCSHYCAHPYDRFL
ncbi:hypothetical protein N665_0809s0015 [Sinapis alba]|nr:hypothetical protein N665_0809s0015 [Sinapis alba]